MLRPFFRVALVAILILATPRATIPNAADTDPSPEEWTKYRGQQFLFQMVSAPIPKQDVHGYYELAHDYLHRARDEFGARIVIDTSSRHHTLGNEETAAQILLAMQVAQNARIIALLEGIERKLTVATPVPARSGSPTKGE